EKFSDQFWRVPTGLVEFGTWGSLWREFGTTRGGGTATSLLPVLALHTFPSEQRPAAAGGFTPWGYVAHRRLATLAGINKSSVKGALDQLETAQLVRRRMVAPPARVGGKPRQEYALATQLFPSDGGRFAMIRASLFYGGTWAVLPSAAARHLYVTIAALDPVIHEPSLAAKLWETSDDADGDLIEFRARHPSSLAALADLTGLARSTLQDALKVLTTPLFAPNGKKRTLALVRSGSAHNGGRWYAIDREAAGWGWSNGHLSKPGALERVRLDHFPELMRMRAEITKRRQGAALRRRERAAAAAKEQAAAHQIPAGSAGLKLER
ncbi:MAG: hypothetical protein ACTHQQ_00695, partial [Solirubrobacteraceae bacterium]